MQLKPVIFVLAISLVPIWVAAGSNHDHDHGHSHGHDDNHGHSHDPASQSQVEKIALDNVSRLANTGKIDKSWLKVGVANSEKKKFGKNLEWVISFKNVKIKETEKQTLYVFLSLTGEYIAANYTGK